MRSAKKKKLFNMITAASVLIAFAALIYVYAITPSQTNKDPDPQAALKSLKEAGRRIHVMGMKTSQLEAMTDMMLNKPDQAINALLPAITKHRNYHLTRDPEYYGIEAELYEELAKCLATTKDKERAEQATTKSRDARYMQRHQRGKEIDEVLATQS